MLCQMCEKKEATFHYKSNENGHITEKHLCRECAEKAGYLGQESYDIFKPFGMIDNFFEDAGEGMLGGMFGSMLDSSPVKTLRESGVCPMCGMRFSDFLHSGKLGCARCYETFSSSLEPTIKRIHGNVLHTGKCPDGRKEHLAKENKLASLKEKLADAIQKQEYENAAKYRDEIRALEQKENPESNRDNENHENNGKDAE